MFYYLLHIPLIHGLAYFWFVRHYGYANFLMKGPGKIPADAGLSRPVVRRPQAPPARRVAERPVTPGQTLVRK